jgi:PAS domain S-box-containing protein
MYFTVALNGTIRSVNQFGASQLGYTLSELLGTSVFSLCHKKDQATVRHQFKSYLQDPSGLEYFECRKVRKDGTVIWIRETIRLVQHTEQEAVLLLVCEDITNQKRGEEAVGLTQQVFDILPDHVSIVGSDYRYRRVNTIYEQVHDLPAQELIGKHISDLFGKQIFRHDIKPHFDRCLDGECVSFEQWFQFPDGQTRFMAVTYSPLRAQDPPNRVEAVVVNSRDFDPLQTDGRGAQRQRRTSTHSLRRTYQD